ncbi:MAG: saccharopine dehydrogenase NADP-binding domain-containing protein [Oceanospirillaceae bacterium]|nr:saccharopine dehydrogenase NADP-binding domain-containing protein [Oceanospirillaceae bacterium]
MSDKSVLVLGGYGNFGKRIVESLAKIANLQVLIAGRNPEKALQLVHRLQPGAAATLQAERVDISAPEFTASLKKLAPDIVIHTSGPFQKQSYQVPQACIEAGAHYIDLSDDRDFVANISELDANARQQQVSVISGASTVPGLSSVVIDHYRSRFSNIESIDIAIAPGNRAERGEATVRAILSYTGHPFPIFKQGRWMDAYGWMDSRTVDFGGVLGKRRLANVDVPDLSLFPERYGVSNRVTFQAGLELALLHQTMVSMASLTKRGWVKNWSPLTVPIVQVSNFFRSLGSDNGGMRIDIRGQDTSGNPLNILWQLYAENGVGPYIPTLSTIIATKKLLDGSITDPGAVPCLGMYSLEEFVKLAREWGIYSEECVNG